MDKYWASVKADLDQKQVRRMGKEKWILARKWRLRLMFAARKVGDFSDKEILLALDGAEWTRRLGRCPSGDHTVLGCPKWENIPCQMCEASVPVRQILRHTVFCWAAYFRC